MATGEDSGQLTRRHIVRLASAISADSMEAIAEGYMDINRETVNNIRRDETNSEAFNREIIRYWANKNPGRNQVNVSTYSHNKLTSKGTKSSEVLQKKNFVRTIQIYDSYLLKVIQIEG